MLNSSPKLYLTLGIYFNKIKANLFAIWYTFLLLKNKNICHIKVWELAELKPLKLIKMVGMDLQYWKLSHDKWELSLSNGSSGNWRLNGDGRIRQIHGSLRRVFPTCTCNEFGITLSEKIEDAELRHVMGDDVLKNKTNCDKSIIKKQKWRASNNDYEVVCN